MDNQELQKDYKKLYEAEREKSEVLVSKIEECEKEIEELNFKLNRIKGSFAWKLATPLRKGLHFYEKTRDRLTRYGSIPGLMRKVRSKVQERKNMKRHGTASFPSPEEAKRQREAVFPNMVKFSILTPLYNTPEKFLTELLDCVKAQTYQNWELCLADGSDHEHAYVGEICKKYAAEDPRIIYHVLEHNEGISGNTNECLKLATGDYIALLDHDDILHPAVLYEYVKAINETGADYIYCDEITFEGDSIDHMIVLHFKPDFAIDNLRGNNYICHFSAFSRELLFRSQYDGSQDHDMILRLTWKAKKVYHVPKALYYWRSHKASVAQDINAKTYAVDAAKRAVHDFIMDVYGMDAKVESTRAFPTIFRIRYPLLERPLISIVIPNKDHMEDLSRCVESIVNKSTYENYEIVIVENNSETKALRTANMCCC